MYDLYVYGHDPDCSDTVADAVADVDAVTDDLAGAVVVASSL